MADIEEEINHSVEEQKAVLENLKELKEIISELDKTGEVVVEDEVSDTIISVTTVQDEDTDALVNLATLDKYLLHWDRQNTKIEYIATEEKYRCDRTFHLR